MAFRQLLSRFRFSSRPWKRSFSALAAARTAPVFSAATPKQRKALPYLLSLAVIVPTALWLDEDSFKEPATGFIFPRTIRNTSEQTLIAAGARSLEMYGIDTIVVKTYALGLYIEPTNSPKYFAEFRSIPEDQINNSHYKVAREVMFHQLLRGKFDVTLRFMPTRDVAGDHLFSSFYRNIKRRYGELGVTEPEKDLKLMQSAFPTKNKIPQGCPIDFTLTAEGQLIIMIGGKVEAVIKNGQLGRAFFEVFLLENTKTPAARREFARGLVRFALSNSE